MKYVPIHTLCGNWECKHLSPSSATKSRLFFNSFKSEQRVHYQNDSRRQWWHFCGRSRSPSNWIVPPNWCRCVCLWREKNPLKTINLVKNVSCVDTALGYKNICTPTFRNTTLSVVRMWAPRTLFPLLQNIHTASPERPHSPNPPDAHRLCTDKRAARMVACLLIHTHTCSKVSEMPSEPPDEKTSPHKQALLMQGEALLFSGTMSVLTFLCLHILSTKSTRKNWGGGDGGGESQCGMQS